MIPMPTFDPNNLPPLSVPKPAFQRIKCGHCKRSHETVDQVKACAARLARVERHLAPVAMATPDPVAGRQHPVPNLVGALAASAPASYGATEANPSGHVPWYRQWTYTVPKELVMALPNGRYAVEVILPGDEPKWIFFRVSRPNKGKRNGKFCVDTQHSDNYRTAFEIDPNGTLRKFSNNLKVTERLSHAMIGAVINRVEAQINYGVELGRCCRCGRKLTDSRSRWYSIGPECEKHLPDVIERIDETKGSYEESVAWVTGE